MKGVCIYDARNVHGGCEAENELFSAPQNLNNSKLLCCSLFCEQGRGGSEKDERWMSEGSK